MTRPRYCPNCAKALSDESHNTQAFSSGEDGGWDCYCDACEWSGDIFPDDEREFVQTGTINPHLLEVVESAIEKALKQ